MNSIVIVVDYLSEPMPAIARAASHDGTFRCVTFLACGLESIVLLLLLMISAELVTSHTHICVYACMVEEEKFNSSLISRLSWGLEQCYFASAIIIIIIVLLWT